MLSTLSLCPSPNPFLPKPISFPSLNPNPRFISFRLNCSNTDTDTDTSSASATTTTAPTPTTAPVQKRRRKRRKFYPGENEGICEEMRFVAMRLRDEKGASEAKEDGETWHPSMEGFIKYLVDSKLVFETVEGIINESSNEDYACFRNSKVERTASLIKDLEWFKEQGYTIPEPGTPGRRYSAYLKALADSSTPMFLCHYYNLYFAHASGGVGIGRKVCQNLFEGREIEFYNWDGDVQILLMEVREALNNLGKQWSREEKDKCLRDAVKSFRYLGQIIRHIISI